MGDDAVSDGKGFVIADRERIEGALDDLARRIHGALGVDFHLVGILRRGLPLAQALGERLSSLRGEEVEVGELRLKRYADDLSILHEEPRLEEDEGDVPFEVEGSKLLLVDDVIYSGRTLLKAACHLVGRGASELRLVALCSRGENAVPVRADFVAMRIDVGEGRVIEVHAPPFEERWEVLLFHQEDLEGHHEDLADGN
ncbi:MAG: phosphoribosyltransferase family protein [Longimicrobiales bacterium]